MGELSIKDRLGKISDFQSAMTAGMGIGLISTSDSNFDEYFKTGEYRRVGLDRSVESLVKNLRRFRSLARIPYAFWNYGRKYQEVYSRVCYANGKDPNTYIEMGDHEFLYKAETHIRDWILGKNVEPTLIGGADYFHVAGIVSVEGDDFDDSGFVSSLVIQAWAVFESLVEDLWIEAINAHPRELATLSGRPRSRFGKPPQQQPPPKGQDQPGKSVLTSSLEAHDFKIENKMGSILYQRGGINFRSITLIRECYHKAFSKAADIDKVLDSDGIQYVSAVRNLLVHKAGKVDQEFKKQTAEIPDIPTVSEGHEFPLTGKIASNLADAATTSAIRLVEYVHKWIVDNP